MRYALTSHSLVVLCVGIISSGVVHADSALAQAQPSANQTQAQPSSGQGQAQPSQTQGQSQPTQGGGTEKGKPYVVVCQKPEQQTKPGMNNCKVDKRTHNGWRVFGAFCARCHGTAAEGGAFAPSLVNRLKIIDLGQFLNVVSNGLVRNIGGQISVMPKWRDNPTVMAHLYDLYAYVKARSDGALPPGEPGLLEEQPATASTAPKE